MLLNGLGVKRKQLLEDLSLLKKLRINESCTGTLACLLDPLFHRRKRKCPWSFYWLKVFIYIYIYIHTHTQRHTYVAWLIDGASFRYTRKG